MTCLTKHSMRNASPWWCFLYMLIVSVSFMTYCSGWVPISTSSRVGHNIRFTTTQRTRQCLIVTFVTSLQKKEDWDDDEDDEDFDFEGAELEEEEEDEVDHEKFVIATGMQQQQEETNDLPPLPQLFSDTEEESDTESTSWSPPPPKEMDETQRRMEEQQRQIDLLMKMVQTQSTEQEEFQQQQQQQQPTEVNVMAPLKAMLFIDGTWLYYSIHGRRESDCPIIKKYGLGWQHRYRIDWNALPRIVCEQMQQQQAGWASRPMEITRASVYTSMKNDTAKQSFRVKMFEEMSNANYDVHCMTTVGKGEKCVDIQLAVEMLHYATVNNAYDVAILLSGDKDFLPALLRTRQKGRKVGIVSMRMGCNRALFESPNVKDYNVVWIEDFLDELLVPLPDAITSELTVSRFTLNKVLYDFLDKSGLTRVSSRDVGRYLKHVKVGDTSLLEQLKMGYGGLYYFLNQGEFFDIVKRKDTVHPGDKSFWVSFRKDSAQTLLEEAKRTHFTKCEKEFFDTYSLEILDAQREKTYFHSLNPDSHFLTPKDSYYGKKDYNVEEEEEAEEPMPAELTKDFSTCTVVQLKDECRTRGLPVSGTKAVLLERLKTDVDSQISAWKEQQAAKRTATKQRINVNSGNNRDANPVVSKHLEGLLREYLQAKGGEASSRDVGRYLAANTSSQRGSCSALTELKEEYGNLASFVASRTDGFATENAGETANYEFRILLREKASN